MHEREVNASYLCGLFKALLPEDRDIFEVNTQKVRLIQMDRHEKRCQECCRNRQVVGGTNVYYPVHILLAISRNFITVLCATGVITGQREISCMHTMKGMCDYDFIPRAIFNEQDSISEVSPQPVGAIGAEVFMQRKAMPEVPFSSSGTTGKAARSPILSGFGENITSEDVKNVRLVWIKCCALKSSFARFLM